MLVFDISNLSLVRVTGRDAIKVLNGLCTAKLADLPGGQATEAMFTDDRGRVIAHSVVALQPDGAAVWIVGQFAAPDKLVAHIDRFIFREDAQLKNYSEQWQAVLLDATSGDDWNEIAQRLSVDPDGQCVNLTVLGEEAWCIWLPITSDHSRILLVPRSDDQPRQGELKNWLATLGFVFGANEELEDRRIANFWPSLAEMTERTLPQELDRDRRAISFTKGCYLGQETVARLDSMGQVQKKLCLVELYGFSEAASGRSLVVEGKEVGQLLSVSPLQCSGKCWGLAYMRRGAMDPGSQFAVSSQPVPNSEAVTGAVVAHP